MMQKKSLAALVATLFAVPFAAHADVTIYGFISSGLESTKATGATDGVTYNSRTRVTDNNSRLGFKGFEDLGNGTKAIWQVESSLRNFEQGGTNDKGQSATLATRNSFVGLDNSSFGQVLVGQNDSAYKTLTYAGLNLFQNDTPENNGAASVYSRGEARLTNSVHYFSPNWAGFQVGASYGADETRTSGTNKNRISVAGNYTNGGLIAALGYDRQNDTGLANTGGTSVSTVAGQSTSYTKLAASYKFATGTLIGGGYEFGRYGTAAGTDLKQDDWTLSLSQDYGAATFKLEYSQLGQLRGVSNPDDYKAKQWTVGAYYALSKATTVYTYYTKINNNGAQNANFANNAVYSSNLGTSTAKLDAGNDPQAFGVGLKVAF